MRVQSLKTKHVTALVNQWLTKPAVKTHKPVSTGTIKNRMAALRWWAGKIGKPGVIPKDNSALGIPNRKHVSDHNKAFKVERHQLENSRRI